MGEKKHRIWELDYFRGVAIILMVIFHLLWNLNRFRIISVDSDSILMWAFQKLIAFLFLSIAGICLYISYSSRKKAKEDHKTAFLVRGLKVLFFAYIITLVTYLIIGREYVRFGVLHLIGSSIIISILFIRFGRWNYLFGSLAIILGTIIEKIYTSVSWLVILGFPYRGFASVDYFPLFPWIGVVLVGIGLGNSLYQKMRSVMHDKLPMEPILGFLGRNSLVIYFLHQPIILLVFYLLGYRL